jgi:hypothetical protein
MNEAYWKNKPTAAKDSQHFAGKHGFSYIQCHTAVVGGGDLGHQDVVESTANRESTVKSSLIENGPIKTGTIKAAPVEFEIVMFLIVLH